MISDYLGSNSSETSTHTTRGLVSKTYYSSWNNSRPALIMGETGDSGGVWAFGATAKLWVYALLGTFCWVRSGGPPRFKISNNNGRFLLALGKSSLFEPVEQVVTGAFCSLQVHFLSRFQLFLLYGGADRCEDTKPVREFCEP